MPDSITSLADLKGVEQTVDTELVGCIDTGRENFLSIWRRWKIALFLKIRFATKTKTTRGKKYKKI